MSPPPNSRSRVQQVRDQLEDDIVNGRMRPGEQVQIEPLMVRFAVSRTPVREALQQLEISGLVEVLPKRGTFVARVGIPELIHMFEVMAELEAMCARLAARRAPTATLDGIRGALEACEHETASDDANAYYYANELFHSLIYQACGNPFLVQQTLALKNRLKPYRRLQLRMRNRIQQSLAEHREIVRALEAGDPEAAAHAAREHVLIQGQRFNDFISLAGPEQAASAERASLPAGTTQGR
ncbi:AsnC family transcriptional regulator [Hydrogenophaga crassostreae]|uniref:AsnC family transcriptional regulator n=1 Tax=Hydrogenophaga crassostreae TaxID=1763535 RepID=A0A162STQ1_9BURK|nr:GntR family transcriptional regulator [Hydrogenophaga crassostreae]AOW13040.1 GntR family transcriptional regulator [Hydrogenophaga crassostreae]OAD40224.1 AsnC family transcriptional regulator [Hydrogenophaga crassostreae]